MTFTVNRNTLNRLQCWKHLRSYLQKQDRNGDWLTMPPTAFEIVNTHLVLQDWVDEGCEHSQIWLDYVQRLVKRLEHNVQTCEDCRITLVDGYVAEWCGMTFCSLEHAVKHLERADIEEGLEDGTFYYTIWEEN